MQKTEQMTLFDPLLPGQEQKRTEMNRTSGAVPETTVSAYAALQMSVPGTPSPAGASALAAKQGRTGTEKTGKRRKKEKKKKPPIPALLRNLEDSAPALKTVMNAFGKDCIKVNPYNRWRNSYGVYIVAQNGTANCVKNMEPDDDRCLKLIAEGGRRDIYRGRAKLIYVADDMSAWTSELNVPDIEIVFRYPHAGYGGGAYDFMPFKTDGYSMTPWKHLDKLELDGTAVQSDAEILNIIEANNSWAAEFVRSNNVSPLMYVLAPQLEQLHKAGYLFAADYFDNEALKDKELVECFNRLTRPGSSLKDIFKTGKQVYSAMKNCCRMDMWDSIRKMDRTGKITPDCVQLVLDSGYSDRHLRKINDILNKTYMGKPVFSWESLVKYLNRIDVNEAICLDEGLQLLDDYLCMCRRLKMQPRIDSDSLKREHDVAARLSYSYHDETERGRVDTTCRKNQAYDYYEQVFFVRHIRDYDELFEEAKNQHNCLASYGSRIADGQSLIYVMREVNNPDRSLITIELSPDGKTVRQALYACNRRIHSRAQSEFIERWNRRCIGISSNTVAV